MLATEGAENTEKKMLSLPVDFGARHSFRWNLKKMLLSSVNSVFSVAKILRGFNLGAFAALREKDL